MGCLAEKETETTFSSSWYGVIGSKTQSTVNYQYTIPLESRKDKFLLNSNDGTKVFPILKSKEENPYFAIDLISDIGPVSNRLPFLSIYIPGELSFDINGLNQSKAGYADKEDIVICTSAGECIARMGATDVMKKQRARQAKTKTREHDITFMGHYPSRHVDIMESYERVIVTEPYAARHEIETSITFGGRLPRRCMK